jgi:hypothetical protein
MAAPGSAPCTYCKTPTTTSNLDGPICDTCIKPFMRGRIVGIDVSIISAGKHGASPTVIDELKKLR